MRSRASNWSKPFQILTATHITSGSIHTSQIVSGSQPEQQVSAKCESSMLHLPALAKSRLCPALTKRVIPIWKSRSWFQSTGPSAFCQVSSGAAFDHPCGIAPDCKCRVTKSRMPVRAHCRHTHRHAQIREPEVQGNTQGNPVWHD